MNDSCSIDIKIRNNGNNIRREPQIEHNLAQFGMVNSVESIGEVDVHNKQILLKVKRIFDSKNHALQLARGVALFAESLLAHAEDVVMICKVR